MPVADGAKCCSSGSKVESDCHVHSGRRERTFERGANLKGSWNVSLQEFQYKKATKLDRPKSKMAAAKVKDKSCKSQPFSTRKRRAPLVDAATAPTPIDVEEDVACIRMRTTSGRCSEISK